MIPFPNISPEIFSVTIGGFEFALRWYAVSYIAGFILAVCIMRYFPNVIIYGNIVLSNGY